MNEKVSFGRSFNIAFESRKLSYSKLDVDLYNSGVNQLLSIAASRGHHIYHFSMQDITSWEGRPYATMSLLQLPESFGGEPSEAYRYLKKFGEDLVPLSDIHLFFLRADDVKPDNPRLSILEQAEKDSIFLVSVKATLDTCDKYELVMRCSGVPMPVTFKADNMKEASDAIKSLPYNGGNFVLKDRFGYGCGKQVHLISFDDMDLREVVSYYLGEYRSIILQEFCPEVRKGDLVLTFFDNEMLGAMKRVAKRGEWRTNASLGATEYPYCADDEQHRIASYVAEKFPGCRFSSVDMFPSGKVLEINAFPGGAGLKRIYGMVVGNKIMDKMEEEARVRFG